MLSSSTSSGKRTEMKTRVSDNLNGDKKLNPQDTVHEYYHFIFTRHMIKGKINIPSFKDIASLVSHLYSASFFSMVLTPAERTNQTCFVSLLYNFFASKGQFLTSKNQNQKFLC